MVPKQSVLLVKYDDAVIASCPEPGDAGVADAGSPDAAASVAASLDAAIFVDANTDDASPTDPSCEEIRGEAITMVVQPQFHINEGGARFALLMVTPSWPIVTTADQEIFRDLAIATAPEVWVQEKYVEDVALGYQCKDPQYKSGCGGGYSAGGGGNWEPPPSDYEPGDPDIPMIDTIGAYEVARLQVGDTDELATWLGDFGYLYSDQDLLAASPYIDQGWTVVAVRIRHDFSISGGLSPLAFSWAGSELRLPTGISLAPPPAESDLTVYVSADRRYDFPASQVSYAKPTGMGGSTFLTRSNMWVDLSQGADADPVAFESTGITQETVTVEQVVRIPSSDCPDDDDEGCGCSVKGAPGVGTLLVVLACLVGLRRRRR
jgi:MYXO-CTERM domain-containing protein